MSDLSQELYNLIGDAVIAQGCPPAEQRRALDRARSDGKRLRPSSAVLKNEMGVSLLIAMWRRDPEYTQLDGTPKVLPIRGKGASLESLVKLCLPQLAIREVVETLRTQCDVMKLKGEKVALLGNSVNLIKRTPATSLAWMIEQIRHLAETCVFNASIPLKQNTGGRFQRQVYGRLSKKEFDVWAQTVRQRLQETSDRVEEELGAPSDGVTDSDDKICGIGLFVFREDGNLG